VRASYFSMAIWTTPKRIPSRHGRTRWIPSSSDGSSPFFNRRQRTSHVRSPFPRLASLASTRQPPPSPPPSPPASPSPEASTLLYTSGTLHVPAMSEATFWARVPAVGAEGQEFGVFPLEDPRNDLRVLVAPALVRPNDADLVPIQVSNPTRQAVDVPTLTPIARLAVDPTISHADLQAAISPTCSYTSWLRGPLTRPLTLISIIHLVSPHDHFWTVVLSLFAFHLHLPPFSDMAEGTH
jgi:hypothetical protein